jgi:PAS domain S-box-containing protein
MAKKPNDKDLKKRKKSKAGVARQLQVLQTLMETIPSPVFYKDTEGVYTGCNRAFQEFVDRPCEEIIGKTVYDMGPKEIADKYHKKDEELFRKAGKQVYEWKVKRKGGETRDVVFNKATIVGPDGKIEGLIGVIIDITKRKQAEEKLRQSESALRAKKNELEEVNKALRALLKQREQDKKELEEKVLSNVKDLAIPYLKKLKTTEMTPSQTAYLRILESNLNEIVSPFIHQLSSKYTSLTSREIQIAQLIKEGSSTRDIAKLMGSSKRTVESHRANIRIKLGLKHKKVNLRSYLSTL